jgi:fatty acid amide hydrolase
VASDVVPAPLPDPAAVKIDKLRIAAWTDDGVFPPSPAVVRAVREAAAMLRQSGAEVIELDAAEVERHFCASEGFDLYCALIGADGGADARRLSAGSTLDPRVARLLWIAGLPRPMRAIVVAGLRQSGQNWTARLVNQARPRSTDAYWQLVDRKNQLAARVIAYMRELRIDALLCPPHALPAMPHVKAFDLLAAGSYAMLINLLGLPSGTVSTTRVAPGEDVGRPTSRDKVLQKAQLTDEGSIGLPIGVQVSGLPWREDIVLALMGALESSAAKRADYPGNFDVPADKSA